MAAQSYYSYDHLPQGDHHSLSPPTSYPSPSARFYDKMNANVSTGSISSGQPSVLKPYHLGAPAEGLAELQKMKMEDDLLKARIRRLRLVSRLLAFAISVAILVPIAMTVHKFLTTRDIFHELTRPDGETISRTAWAKDSKVWPTYIYFAIAVIAALLHVIILVSYTFSVQQANRSAIVTAIFSWGVMVGNLVVWIVAAVIYRREKDLDGKSNDLWGWTCSAAAREIQQVFAAEVNYNQYCNIQTASWYAGLVQVGAAALTIFIYILAVQRRKLKKRLHRQSQVVGFEPVRH